MEEARRVDETIRTRTGSFIGHDLRDIRVHDSQQASDLAGRLGGEAASIAGHTYGSLDKVTAGSKEGAGLPVRERMHMIRRTGARPLPLAPPLRMYQTPSSGGNAISTQPSEGVTVQRQGKKTMAQRAVEADIPRTQSPRRSSSASSTGLEEMANMVYSMMMRDLELEKERRP